MSKTPAKIWFAVDIVADAEAAEAIEFALNELESIGTEIDSLRKAKGEPQLVTGFFDSLPEGADIRFAVEESLWIHGLTTDAVKSTATRRVEETDWLAEWKKYWKPTEIGRFIITPPWEKVADTDKIVIQIEPNMAFGTGTHETTQLCLQAIGDTYKAGQTFLDVGTGTGILAIAVARLATEDKESTENENKNLSVSPVAKLLACDTDIDSVRIAKENAIANSVGELIEFRDGPIDQETPVFDFVCANLTIDVIVPILPLLLAKTRHILLLSGILGIQTETVTTELNKAQISNFQIGTAGEWISVIVEKVKAETRPVGSVF